jgi:hypothetical protein
MTIDIKIKIERDILENIFITALEGGSNYWYYLNKENYMKAKNSCGLGVPSENVFSAVYDKGIDIEIHDAEDEDELLGTISKATLEPRLQKMVDDGFGHALMSEINEEGDAETSDMIFQYIVMGEIVYG